MARDERDDDISPVFDDSKDRPRLTPGRYLVRCTKAKWEWKGMFSAWKCVLTLADATDPDTPEVTAWLNGGTYRKHPITGQFSRYRPLWCEVNGGPPRRGDRMSPRIFIGQFFEITVEDIIKRHDGSEHPEELRYSAVRKIEHKKP
jgi:hypothetical protein